MSEWYEPNIKDVFFDEEIEEVHIWYDSDEWGNNYVVLTFDQIDEIYNKIHNTTTDIKR